MFDSVGLKRGSLMSAGKLCLSLISPSHSVLTKRLETKASRAEESRFTWASFHRRSRTSSLLSRGSAFWAAIPTETTSRKQQMLRIMRVHARRHPHVRRTSADNNNFGWDGATELRSAELRTSWYVAIVHRNWQWKLPAPFNTP